MEGETENAPAITFLSLADNSFSFLESSTMKLSVALTVFVCSVAVAGKKVKLHLGVRKPL